MATLTAYIFGMKHDIDSLLEVAFFNQNVVWLQLTLMLTEEEPWVSGGGFRGRLYRQRCFSLCQVECEALPPEKF